MDLRFDPTQTRELEALAKKFPEASLRAFKYACGIMLKNMRSRMSGKNKNIAQWSEFTRMLRGRRRFGGRLGGTKKDDSSLTMWATGPESMHIGWIDGLAAAAEKFQSGGSEPTTTKFRGWVYQRRPDIPRGLVPKVANTPARPVIDPVAAESQKHFPDWMIGAIGKVLSGQIKRWEGVYLKNASRRQGAAAARKVASAMDGLAMLKHYEAVKRGAYG